MFVGTSAREAAAILRHAKNMLGATPDMHFQKVLIYGVPSGIGTLSAERAYSEGIP